MIAGSEQPDNISARSHPPVEGNVFDKYGSGNPIVRLLMAGYFRSFDRMLADLRPGQILEIGCGEGVVGARVQARFPDAHYRGCDLSPVIIEEARRRYPGLTFEVCSIYDLTAMDVEPDLAIAVEVLEHLERPAEGLASLLRLRPRYLLLSVPREPIWRFLNLLRGRYIAEGGNTPGHLNHWSRKGIVKFVRNCADGMEIVAVANPFPWTMILCRRVPSS